MNFEKNIVLAPYTSWLIGGPADFFCLPENEKDLKIALKFSQEHQIPITVLGGGSNVLVADEGVSGLVVCLKMMKGLRSSEIRIPEYHFNNSLLKDQTALAVECLAGTPKSELLRLFLKHRLAPALFLAGLPGDVGGGIVMNAGVSENYFPREFREIVSSIEIMFWNEASQSVEVKVLQQQDIEWEYRHSSGWQPGIISKIHLLWPMLCDETILEKVRTANRNRALKQPLEKPSCGSVFKNPGSLKAAKLIDQCGLKGQSIGAAQISTKHSNFIVNLGGATAKDTWALIELIQNEVNSKKQVQLQTEVVRIGRWNF